MKVERSFRVPFCLFSFKSMHLINNNKSNTHTWVSNTFISRMWYWWYKASLACLQSWNTCQNNTNHMKWSRFSRQCFYFWALVGITMHWNWVKFKFCLVCSCRENSASSFMRQKYRCVCSVFWFFIHVKYLQYITTLKNVLQSFIKTRSSKC